MNNNGDIVRGGGGGGWLPWCQYLPTAAIQSQIEVIAYLKSKQLLHLRLEEKYSICQLEK